jgi:hypothetical protein
MTALEALQLARSNGVEVIVDGDIVRCRSKGEAPPKVIEAVKAAKLEFVALIGGYSLDNTGALHGHDLLYRLSQLGFRVRRYGDNASVDDDSLDDRVPPRPLLYEFGSCQSRFADALIALGAPNVQHDRTLGFEPSEPLHNLPW